MANKKVVWIKVTTDKPNTPAPASGETDKKVYLMTEDASSPGWFFLTSTTKSWLDSATTAFLNDTTVTFTSDNTKEIHHRCQEDYAYNTAPGSGTAPINPDEHQRISAFSTP